MKVSVIIPCYNGEEYIGQTLGSLFDQTRPADEIIVVDDGSDDRSVEIAQCFGDPVTILLKGGGGAANARNCGADYATGDALMFLDADDVLSPDVLEHLLAQLELNPKGVVACPWFRLDKIEEKWVKQPPSCATLGENQDYLSGWITGWYHLPCSILWSRIAYERTGGWDPRAYVNDDGDLMMRALVDGIELQITDKGASFYRRMPEEKQSESLSGARFTRAGREAQIYVMKKIAQRLEDRGRLKAYRKYFTRALDRYRKLCEPHYPDLSKECTDLINRHGEPRFLRAARKLIGIGRFVLRTARRFVSRVKNKMLSTSYPNQNDVKNYEEIRFGLDTYREASSQRKEGKVLVPSRPAVSVVLPIYNQTSQINDTLKSVLDQEYENYEVIVVTNVSDEKIKEQFKDPRIRFVVDMSIQNISAAHNRGLNQVKGDFVAFLNPQDEWFPDKLLKQIKLFQSATDKVGVVYSGMEFVTEKGESSEFHPEARGNIYRESLLRNIIGSCSSVMMRRTVIPSAGFFDETLSARAEHDYWLRIARYFEFDFVKKPLVRKYNFFDNSRSPEARKKFFDKHHRELKRTGFDGKF